MNNDSVGNDSAGAGTPTDLSLHQLTMRMSELDSLKDNANVMFLVVMGSLVLFMQAGFVLQATGNYRSKNLLNIFAKNLGDVCFGAIAFWICGYAFAFSKGDGFLGYHYFITWNMPKLLYAQLFFQYTFAGSCSCLLTGAIAERSEYFGSLLCSGLIVGLVYPVHTHWCWGPGGWLANKGFHDFAGSGVVHLAGGTWAAIACVLIGPSRESRKLGRPAIVRGHSFPQIMLAYFIILFGFLGFNGGSQGSIANDGDGETVALVIVTTVVACSAGTITVLFVQRFRTGHWKMSASVNGGIIGMASVCCGCDGFYPWSACLVGAVAGCIYVLGAKIVEKVNIDDPMGTIATHVGGGMWGLIAGPIFHEKGGLLGSDPSTGAQMLLWNFVGMVCIILWNGCWALTVLGTLKWLGLLRISDETEILGQDIVKHGDVAYSEWSDGLWYVRNDNNSNNNRNNSSINSSNNSTRSSNMVFPVMDRRRSKFDLTNIITIKPSGGGGNSNRRNDKQLY